MNINYEYYRVFYYVVKYRNFTQAANRLLNNQPNISRIIRNLEDELGCQLFVRSSRGVTLTPEGEALYSHIRIAVKQITAGEQELQHLIDLQGGTLSIGVSEVALRCFLLPILNEYQSRYPHVRLKVSNHTTPQAISALQQGVVDIAFVTSPIVNAQHLTVTPLKKIREVPVCGSNFAFLAGRELSLQELTRYPIVSLGQQTQTYAVYAELFENSGLSFSPDIELTTADQILPMVRNNLGIGFVTEEFLEEENPDVYPLCLNVPLPNRTICCVENPDTPLSISARKLTEMLPNRIIT